MKGFLSFIERQGIVGLAVGFILGGAVSKLVSAFVNDIINPIIGVILGLAKGLETANIKIGPIKILYGDFISNLINFLIISVIIYLIVRLLRLDKIDKKINLKVMEKSKEKRVFDLVSKIPKGKVMTYGQISRTLKINSPRLVGQILHKNKHPEKVPCHRVVFADGSLSANYAFGGKKTQREKLEKEGVKFFKNNKVSLL